MVQRGTGGAFLSEMAQTVSERVKDRVVFREALVENGLTLLRLN